MLIKISHFFLLSMSNSTRQGAELSAISLIDECIEYSENGYQQLPASVQQRVCSILSAFRSKSIKANSPNEIGDLIASLAELVPIQSQLFSELCESISTLCIDREFVYFEEEALQTVSAIILKHLELRSFDPSPGLRALSTLLYNNTTRVVSLHERIVEIAISLSTVSDESHRRSCVLLGNLTAFSNKKLARPIYTKSIKFLLTALTFTGTELLSSALRALQLLILDAPTDVLDPQALAQTISVIAFRQCPTTLKFEALMALKALANTSKSAFYAQWDLLLTKSPSIFDLLKTNIRVSKAAADLLTDIFRDTWKFLYIADNTSKKSSFTTLAQQIGDVINVCFNRFLQALDRTAQHKLDPAVFNRVAKAFATFVRNCSFDSGRLKAGYIEKIVQWCKDVLMAATEEALIVMKSLLWTDIKFKPFADNFQYLFQTFISFIANPNPDFSKPASFALCRLAYAYPQECVNNWKILGPKLREIGPIHSLPILLRLAENGITDLDIWLEILQYHIPTSFEINHVKSIQRSLQCIGLASVVFDQLPDNLQRFCMSTVLGADGPEADHSVALLTKTEAADKSPVFLCDAFMRLSSNDQTHLQALSNVLEAYALRHKAEFRPEWTATVLKCLERENSPYRARCIGFLFAFVNDENQNQLNDMIVDSLGSEDPKMRWNAATALAYAFQFGHVREDLISLLVKALEDDRIAKVKIKAVDALLCVESRQLFGELFHQVIILVLQFLLVPAHFTNLPIATHRKYDAAFREGLTKLFFKLIDWTSARDFSALEEAFIANVDYIYDIMDGQENAPWENVTRLYEAKFNSIPSKMLEKFQDKAFPIDEAEATPEQE